MGKVELTQWFQILEDRSVLKRLREEVVSESGRDYCVPQCLSSLFI